MSIDNEISRLKRQYNIDKNEQNFRFLSDALAKIGKKALVARRVFFCLLAEYCEDDASYLRIRNDRFCKEVFIWSDWSFDKGIVYLSSKYERGNIKISYYDLYYPDRKERDSIPIVGNIYRVGNIFKRGRDILYMSKIEEKLEIIDLVEIKIESDIRYPEG